MKTMSVCLLISFFTNMAHAMGDLERGFLFLSNAYSYGTMLPDIEGRIAVKKLEYEKKKAEFNQQLEKNRQNLLKQYIQNERSRQQEFRAFWRNSNNSFKRKAILSMMLSPWRKNSFRES